MSPDAPPAPPAADALADVADRLHRLEDAHVRLRHLQALTAALAVARTPGDIAAALLGEGLDVFGADAANVYALTADGAHLEQLGVWGEQGVEAAQRRTVPLDVGLPHCEAARTGRPVWLLSPADIVRWGPHLEASRAQLGHHAWVSLPLVAQGRVLGVVGLAFAAPVAFGPDVRAYLETAISLAAQALGRAAADVAERRAAAALADREAQLRAVLDASPAAIFVLDLEGRYLRVNPAFARVAGRSAGEVLGRRASDLFPPEVAATARARTREALASGQPVASEEEVPGAEGPRTFLTLRTPLVGDDGRFSAVCVVATDVTELRRQREALQLTEQRYGLVLRATRDAVWDLDLATGAVLWNGEVEQLFGHTREALGTTPEGWLARLHPEDRARVEAEVERTLAGSASTLLVEYRFARADGRWALVVDRGYVLRDGAGRAVRMVGAMQDVTDARRAATELARSEGRLRALVHATSQVLWTADAEGRVRTPSASWTAFTGQAEEAFVGAGWLDAVHPEDRERARAAWDAAWAAGERYEVDYRLRRPDGGFTWTRAYGAPVRDPATGRVVEWMGMNLDISEAKRAEEFEQQLLGIVSHDLRNPLAAVRFAAEMVRRGGPLTPPQQRALGRVETATERSLRMVRDLLDFTQARLGRGLTVAPVEADPHALLEDVAAEVREAYAGRTVVVHTHGPPRAWLDPDRTAQLLTNLLANAATYGAPDQPVTATCTADALGVVYEVHNAGEPIPPALLPDLFEPLRRGSAVGGEARSIGLGLYIVRQLVLAHGGDITVTSTPAGGTRFRVALPARA